VARPTDAATTITQHVVHLPTNDAKAKRTALRRVIEACDVKNGIVFCNRKVEVDIVAASLTKHGHDAAPIHGDLPQSVRTETLQKFRDGDLKLLVASDVAARGLDIPDVGHVFNYGPPPKDEDYIHRIGRTGRAGRTGESYTLVSPVDEKSWGFVLKMIDKDVEEFMPEGLLEEIENLPPEENSGRGRRGSSRDGGRSRGGRGERSSGGRSRSRREETQKDDAETTTASEQPDAPVKEHAPAKPETAAKPDKPEKAEKTDKAEKAEKSEKTEKAEKSDKPKRERAERKEKPKRDRKRKDDDLILDPAPENVKGFGNDIPAFLKR
jgi:superfamily II DNA/RNA helicase